MKTMIRAVMLGAALFWPVAYAQQDKGNADEHAGHHPPAAATQDQDQSAHQHAGAGELQKNAKKMQDLMAQIQRASDPAQKRELLAEHLQVMREQIRLMQASAKAGAMMMSRREAAGAEDADQEPGASDTPDQKTKCTMMGEGGCKMMKQKGGGMMRGGMMGGMMMMHKQVEQRLQAIEQLLEQIIEYEAGEASIENR